VHYTPESGDIRRRSQEDIINMNLEIVFMEECMMLFGDLNWMDVESYLKQDDRLMFVLGACEQHGYLSLLTDAKIPQAIADAASKETNILVAPVLNFGVSPYFLSYPGTMSLKLSTYLNVVEDLVCGAYRQGFRRIVIVNGHGSNEPVFLRLVELMNELSGLKIGWHSWWKTENVKNFADKNQLGLFHASWMEAFPFTKVAEIPNGIKLAPKADGILNAEQTRQVYGDGVYGGDYQVSDEIMDKLFRVCLDDLLDVIRKI
jgi:creatinine amidohydrolase